MATPDTVSFGYEQVPAGEKTAMVGEVFSRVARKYDIMNDAMSGGMHRLWKDRFVRRVKPRAGEAILDMAGGTGDIAFRMEPSGASITVADIKAAGKIVTATDMHYAPFDMLNNGLMKA